MTSALLTAGVLLAGCSTEAVDTPIPSLTSETGLQASESALAPSEGGLSPVEVMAENADYTVVNDDEWSEGEAIDIALAGTSATISSGSNSVEVASGAVTITAAGVYRLSGELTGQVIVDAPDDAQVVLMLDGASISNTGGSAIEVRSADDAAISLVDGTQNVVSDAASCPDDAEANAAIYADTDLTISGLGSLVVNANGNDGITSKDDLVILSGDITVTAADDALSGKDSLVVVGGSLQLTAYAGDGMKSDQEDGWDRGFIYVLGGEIDITAGDDGLQAQTDTVIAGGSVTVDAVDDGIKGEVTVSIGRGVEGVDPVVIVAASTEGLEAANIGISAGVITITASDDGINASGNAELQALINGTEYVEGNREADTGERLEISGGEVTIVAGSDGLDSNGTITITGGTVDITAVDRGGDGPVDANGAVEIAEGTVTANGSAYDPATAGGMGGMPGGMGGGPGGMPGGQAPGGSGF